LHDDRPVTLANLPATHAAQRDSACAPAKVPFPHGVHVERPDLSAYLPVAHALHEPAPGARGTVLNRPTVQFTHADRDPSAQLPSVQLRQALGLVAPACGPYLPKSHPLQNAAVDPTAPLYLPA
jgi:hypothetical protein